MPSPARLSALLVSVLAVSGVARAERAAPPLINWSAPATYSPSGSSKIRALTDISSPVPFVTIAPCRQYNSLLATPLAQGVNRAVPLTGAPCNIPTSAVAVSVNITVFNITGATGNGVFKVDTVTPPAVAWINYPPSEAQRGNAGVVALNGSGQIIVQVAQGAGQVDFVVDTNGYYSSALNTPFGLDINAGQPAIQVQNVSPFCSSHCGLTSEVGSTSGGDAIFGWAYGGSGTNYGVIGLTSSASSGTAGVLGYEGGSRATAPANYLRAGVRGESVAGYGVLGVSRSTGVGAALVDSGGSQLAYALLAAAGPTNYAVFAGGDFGGIGAKYFVEPHPADPTKVIRYVSLEGPQSGTYFYGSAQVINGQAVIRVPEDFRIVTDSEGLAVQLTPVGAPADLYVVSEDLNQIVVQSNRDVRFHYMVNGVRKAFKDHQAIGDGTEFMPRSVSERMPAYLTEEAKRRLIENGTYNADGTVNMETAVRVGWVKAWADREAQAQAASRQAQKEATAKQR